MNSSDKLQRCLSWLPKFQTLAFTLTFKDCNIWLKYKYFNEIIVGIQVHIAIHFVTSVHKFNKQLVHIFTEREVGEWEEHLKVSGNLLKPIVNRFIELKAKVSNLNSCRTSTTQSISMPSLHLNSIPTSTVYNTMNSSDKLQRCLSWLPKFQTLPFTLTLEVCKIWMKSKCFDENTPQHQNNFSRHYVTSLNKSY